MERRRKGTVTQGKRWKYCSRLTNDNRFQQWKRDFWRKWEPFAEFNRFLVDHDGRFVYEISEEEFRFSLSKVLSEYGSHVIYEQAVRHQIEIMEMVKAGVIKMASFIPFFKNKYPGTKKHPRTMADAVKNVAYIYGMNPQTQSVYLSDEFKLRQREKKKSKLKKLHV